MTRPETLPTWVEKLPTSYGTVYLRVSELDGKPYEMFVTVGKGGQGIQALCEPIGKLATELFRDGKPVARIVELLKGIQDDAPTPCKTWVNLSIADAIGQALERRYLWRKINGK